MLMCVAEDGVNLTSDVTFCFTLGFPKAGKFQQKKKI